MALFNGKELIHLEFSEPIDMSARPPDLQNLDDFSLPNAKVQAQVVLGIVAPTATHFSHLSYLAGDTNDPGSDRAAIGPLPHEFDLQPVTQPLSVVSQQLRDGIHRVDDDVYVSVVVNVTECRSTRRNELLDCIAGQPGDVTESSVAEIF